MKTMKHFLAYLASIIILIALNAPAQPRFATDFNSGVPAGMTLYTPAVVESSGGVGGSGALKLTKADQFGVVGNAIISDFNSGQPVTQFTARMKIHIGEGTARPADGFSFSFGPDLPAGGITEDGAGSGIRVTLDTWDNNTPDTAPAMDLVVGGVTVAFQSMAGEREGGRAPDGPFITDPATGQPMTLRNNPGEYSDLIIRLKTDKTIDVIYKNVVIFNNVATAYAPTAGRWAFGARTGGASDNHWVDNLDIFLSAASGAPVIIAQPASLTALENTLATLEVVADGTPPFAYQWLANGAGIPGATGSTLSGVATMDLNGVAFTVRVSNASGSVVSAPAILTVIPDTTRPVLVSASTDLRLNKVKVTYSEAVDPTSATAPANYKIANGGTQYAVTGGTMLGTNQVELTTVPLPEGTTLTLTVNNVKDRAAAGNTVAPNSQATFPTPVRAFRRFFSAFDSLPAATTPWGNARVDSGILKINDAVNGAAGTYIINDFNNGQGVVQFAMQAQIRIAEATCCTAGRNELRPADGMSINFAPDIPDGTAWSAGALEEGVGTGLRLTLDTWDSGDPDTAPAIELVYNGVSKAVAPLDGWRDNNIPNAGLIPIDPQNGAPLTLYTDARDQTFVKVTSGANAGQIYQCHQGGTSLDIGTLPDGTLAGPTVYIGLACDTNIPAAPAPGTIALSQRGVCTFQLKAENAQAAGYAGIIIMNDAARGEDHFGMGGTIPATMPAVMIGHSRGLAIAGVASAAELVVGNPGANVSMVRTTPPVAPYGQLVWTLDPDGTCDVWWKGVKIINNVQTGYQPMAGRFGFGGRTGGANESHWIDDLNINLYGTASGPAKIVSQPVSTTVLQNDPVKFEVFADGAPPLTYQWRANGVDLPGENNPVLSRSQALLEDDQLSLTVVVANAEGSETSQEAILSIIPDTFSPTVRSAAGSPTFDKITITFSEALDSGTAIDTANYAVTESLTGNPLTASSAVLNPDGVSVTLTLDPATLQMENTLYTVTMYYVADLVGNPIADGTTAEFRSFVISAGGGLTMEIYEGIGGTAVADLLNAAIFPNSPTRVYRLNTFDTHELGFNNTIADNYGARIRGLFVPPTTAKWKFYIGSDDASQVFLNPNGPDPAGKIKIAEETGCCKTIASISSGLFSLVGGQAYYLEALYKEGGGGDYMIVVAKMDGEAAPACTDGNTGACPESIPLIQLGQVMAPGAAGTVTITQQPANKAALQYQQVCFTVQAQNTYGLGQAYQWRKNGAAIPGATASSYCVQATQADSGAVFDVVISILGNTATSAGANLTVTPEEFSPGFAKQDIWFGIGGVLISDLVNNPAYTGIPSISRYRPALEANTFDEADNYGTRITGWLKPPTSGNYNFAIAADDQASFWLSTDVSPANKVLVASEPTWNCRRDWVTDCAGSRNDAAPENVSTTLFPGGIPLVAGNLYYFEAFMKEGGGGDSLAVTWQMPGDPAIAAVNTPIPGKYIVQLAEPLGATIEITQQPADLTYVIYPTTTGAPDPVWTEDFNAGNGGFAVANRETPGKPWAYNAGTGSWSASDRTDCATAPRSSYLNSPLLQVTANGMTEVTFEHRYSFEADSTLWDGGQLRVRVNGGAYLAVPAANFTANGYNGVIGGGGQTPNSEIVGQEAFTAGSAGHGSGAYITSKATLGPYTAGDQISIQFLAAWDDCSEGLEPNWEINSIAVTDVRPLQSAPAFTVAVQANLPGNAGQTPAYQWQRNNGAGYFDIAGANAASYSLTPLLADNSAKFRCEVYFPTLPMTLSGEATLTVVQANTPPSFTKGPDQNVQCSAPAATVPGWASDIQPHSIPRNPVAYGSDFASGPLTPVQRTFASDFSSSPAGVALYGNAAVNGGVLHLTDAANGQSGGFIVNSLVPPFKLTAFNMTFNMRLGGGTYPPADGMAFSVGSDVDGAFGEEGAGSGLTVCFDTWDNTDADPANGTGEAPRIDVKWGGVEIATTLVPLATLVTDPNFIPVAIKLDADGTLDVVVNGTPIYTDLATGFTGIPAARFGFGARTGGANANHWIDDLNIVADTFQGTPPPPGSAVTGTAYVADGYLHLTDAANGAYGAFHTPAISTLVESYDVSFKAAVGGGTCCGDPTTGNPNATADGFSVNISADLPAPGVAEDGEGNGLSICFDTWDSGGGEAPAIDLKWQGRFLAKYPIQVAQAPAPAVPTFIPVTISVGSAGNVTVTYNGMTIFDNFMLPDYRAQTGLRLGMAARTGGANQAHWIDDLAITAYPLDASSVEAGQTVQFIVSNDNPALFAAQPALSPDGTLAYQAAAGAVGAANVTVVAKDNGGSAYGGNDTSAPQTFVITVRDTIPPTLSGCPANLTAECGVPVSYPVTAFDACAGVLPVVCNPPAGTPLPAGIYTANCTAVDPSTNTATCAFTLTVVDTPPVVVCPADITVEATTDTGAVVTYTATAADQCGGIATFACTPPSGSTFPIGTTPVTCTATDIAGNSASCTFRVTVTPLNEPPVCDTQFPCTWTESGTTYAIALDNMAACVVLDGSGTTDPDNDPLTFTWIVDGTNSTSGAVVTNCLPTGCHSVVLVVNDGLAESRCERTLCVITAGEAIEQLIALVDSTTVARKNKRPLIASLKAAQASFDRGSMNSGLNQLKAFQNKVRAQIAKENPAEAAAFIAGAQKIIDAVNCASE